ncbi:MAG: secondary thiamine-phosphate synthase enzyme YjbQ [Nitrososphaerota archaeon]
MNKIILRTEGEEDIIDITDDINEVLRKENKQQGVATIFVTGSTCAVTTIEYENGLLDDFRETLRRLFPKSRDYKHEFAYHDGNAHSHIRSSMIGTSLSIPFVNNKLVLGVWQRVVFIELDVKPREREIIVQSTAD